MGQFPSARLFQSHLPMGRSHPLRHPLEMGQTTTSEQRGPVGEESLFSPHRLPRLVVLYGRDKEALPLPHGFYPDPSPRQDPRTGQPVSSRMGCLLRPTQDHGKDPKKARYFLRGHPRKTERSWNTAGSGGVQSFVTARARCGETRTPGSEEGMAQ